MELEPIVIKCAKCSEQMQIFLQKQQAVGFSQDAELKTKVNEIIKSLSQISMELEDKEARLAKIEDFLTAPSPPR